MISSSGMQRSLTTLVFFLAIAVSSFAQKGNGNGVLLKIESMADDQEKVDLLLTVLDSASSLSDNLDIAKKAYLLSKQLNYKAGQARSAYYYGNELGENQAYIESKEYLTEALAYANDKVDLKLKADVLYCLALNLDEQNFIDSAFTYYQEALQFSDSIEYYYRSAQVNYSISGLYNAIGQNDRAIDYALEAEGIYQNHLIGKDASHVFNLLGIIYEETAKQGEAFKYYYKCLEAAERSGDVNGEVMVLNNLAILYDQIGKKEEAKEFYWTAIEKSHIHGFNELESYLQGNLGELYMDMGDTLKSFMAIKNAYALTEKYGDRCDLAYPLEGLGRLCIKRAKYDSALQLFDESIAIANECMNKPLLASAYRNKGVLYVTQSNFKEGINWLLKGEELAKETKLLDELKRTYFALYEANKKMGNASRSLDYYEAYQATKDSIMSEKEASEIARITSNYELEKKLQMLDYKKQADFMRLEYEIEKQTSDKNGLYVILAMAAVLGLTLGRAYFLLQKQNKKLQQINEEKNTLMGVVAHDLRSPLNNIKGLLSLVNLKEDSEQLTYSNMLNDSVDRMRDMIDRVMDISAIEEMKVNLNLGRHDLGKLAHQVTNNYRFVANQKRIKIVCEVDEKLHFANIDDKYTLQVFDNLMSNAIKYSNADTQITVYIEADNGNWLVKFKDEGLGISKEDMRKLFTKYQMLSARPTGNEESIGLGLSIVKKFVTAMGGEITCESELGKGSTFIVSLKKV
ncbi:ATP-binding protein [Reichenbachiella ulvae]|uniref:histidine kinase n=1 Tax=Reichenbachiella ulvae TaxID=2980104 RepID=A0ABT3CQ31_9BACT|nr:tetratricopeptide repeat-containing sensor histidine kinase [Reichenbachiella ulvae]MCV9385806.1 tetratricopeptide repeat-containing sensor histidine kinase [Reichenbachiella ulvae]